MIETVLRIIELSLQLTLEIVRSVPPEEKARHWKQHYDFVDWLQRASGIKKDAMSREELGRIDPALAQRLAASGEIVPADQLGGGGTVDPRPQKFEIRRYINGVLENFYTQTDITADKAQAAFVDYVMDIWRRQQNVPVYVIVICYRAPYPAPSFVVHEFSYQPVAKIQAVVHAV